MEGVTILSEGLNLTAKDWYLFSILAILGGVAYHFAIEHKKYFIRFLGIVSFAIIVGLNSNYVGKITRPRYIEYKVIISENVKLREFNNKYEILEQEGDIFTVKERER